MHRLFLSSVIQIDTGKIKIENRKCRLEYTPFRFEKYQPSQESQKIT